jgi:hypothetical protein
MPRYEFLCPACGTRRDVDLRVAERDAVMILCVANGCVSPTPMARVPSAPGVAFRGLPHRESNIGRAIRKVRAS